ncbi:MAG: zinc ABC transporter substrate-binding protein [Planctomycetota bacterium]
MKRLLLFLTLWAPLAAHAALNVFACEPEWAALATEIGGGDVRVYAATTAQQDPHRIEARPSLIAQMRRADLVVCSGAELEAAWLPLLLREAGNPGVQPGRPGYFEATRFVALRDKPASLDRAQGDVHAAGNPHIHTDPRNIARVGAALAQRIGELDPSRAAAYQRRWQAFSARWTAAIAAWEARAAPLKGMPVVVQHASFSYLVAWLHLREVATLEPRPGVDPSASHLARVAAQLQADPPRAVLRAAYQSPRPADWVAQRLGVPALTLPFTVGGSARATDLFALFDETLDLLLRAAS